MDVKKLIIFIILLTSIGYSQNRIIRQDSLRLSEAAVKTVLRGELLAKSAFNDSLSTYGYQTATQVKTIISDSMSVERTARASADAALQDSVTYHWQQILYHAGRIDNLEAANETNLLSRIETLESNQGSNDLSISALFDSVASLRSSIGFITPTFPDAPTGLIAIGRTTDILVKWDTMTADSFQLNIYNSDPSLGGDPIVTSVYLTDTFYVYAGIAKNTIFWFNSQAWRGNEFSAISNIDSAYVSEVAPSGEGEYTDTLYVSASATGTGTGQTVGSPYTLTQAINSANAGNLVILAVGAYDIEGNLDFTRDGTTANPIEWRGIIDPSDSAGLTYSANSTVFYPSVFSGSNTNPPFEVFGEHNTFKNILFYNNISQQVALIRVDADAVGTTFEGINFKYPINTSSSSHHSIRIYCDSVTIKNSYFNRGSRTIIWIETNGDGENTVNGFLVENNVFTGASNHPAIQIMPNTFTAAPNKVANGIVRNNLFIDNPYSALYLRWFESIQVYNNLFIRSGVRIVDIDKSEPTELDSVNSKGSIFAFNTLIGTACTFTNRQHNQLVYANNLIVGTTLPSDLYWFGNNATGEARFDQRHYFDYNYFYYSSGNVTSVNSTYCIGDDSYTTVNWTNWLGTYGFDTHSTINTAPTFTDSGNDDYTPLNGTSPQVGKGTPITTSAGFIGNILTDKNGNVRDATNPTCGAYE